MELVLALADLAEEAALIIDEEVGVASQEDVEYDVN